MPKMKPPASCREPLKLPPSYQGGNGPPLLLLHGGGATWHTWDKVLPLLEAEHAVFAPTLPGHCGGEAIPPGSQVTVHSLTTAVERQLDRAGIERAHIAGNSLGGWIALELARRGRASSVVALSPGGAWRRPADIARALWSLRVSYRLLDLLADRLDCLILRPRGRRLLLRQMMYHGERMTPTEVRDGLRASLDCPGLLPLLGTVMRGQLEPLPDLPDCPIRIAWGEKDRLVPLDRFAQPLLQRVPQAELVILPGVGHVPMGDDRELVARTILEVTRAAERRSGATAADDAAYNREATF
jgi:pimeloyl-ACP methyl ester carboxylesterase